MSRLGRPLRDDEIAAYERDGVVCLRQVLPRDWLQRMEEPLEEALRHRATVDMTRMARRLAEAGKQTLADVATLRTPASGPERGRFFGGTDHWRHQPPFRAFALDSPLPELAALLMRSARVQLYEDSVLVKEPGGEEQTAFHQDLGYFHVEGDQVCTFWCPLDPVDRESGAVCFVRGSHRWGRLFRPNLFVSRDPIPGSEGEEVPDVAGRPECYELVRFELEPGDVTVHHACTLHGAAANRSSARRRRAISVRYCGDDVRFRVRRGSPRKDHHAGMQEGAPLDPDACPVAWPG